MPLLLLLYYVGVQKSGGVGVEVREWGDVVMDDGWMAHCGWVQEEELGRVWTRMASVTSQASTGWEGCVKLKALLFGHLVSASLIYKRHTCCCCLSRLVVSCKAVRSWLGPLADSAAARARPALRRSSWKDGHVNGLFISRTAGELMWGYEVGSA